MQKLFIVTVVSVLIITGCRKSKSGFDSILVPIDLSIPSDSIKLNPYGYTPLSAIVNFSTSLVGKTVIIVKGKNGDATNIKHVFTDDGLNHSVEIIGLYGNYLNTVYIRLVNNKGDTVAKATINIQTTPLPTNLPTSIEDDVLLNPNLENGLNLVSNFSADNPQIAFMSDNYGDIRWVLDYTTHPTLNKLFYDNGIKRLRNGNLFFGDVITNKFYEINLVGKILNTWDLNQTDFRFHHDIYEKPDGNFITSVSKIGSLQFDGTTPAIQDYIVEIDRKSGSVKTVWDLKQLLDPARTILTSDIGDWIHVNSVLYDSTDNTIIVSGRTQGVVKLTFDNQIKWILAPHKGWGINKKGEDLNKFLLTPLSSDGKPISDVAVLTGYLNHPDFEWNWYQHSVIQLPNGNIMLFDNGTIRNYNSTLTNYSRAVEYKIDPVNMTVQQKWQYGKERGIETFSQIVSSVQFLPTTNHVLFCPGYRVVNNKGYGGKIVEVDYTTKQVVLQQSFCSVNGWGFHRAKRITAYPE